MADDILTDTQAEALLQQVLTCEPILPPDQLDTLADRVFSKELIIRPWRMTALLATKDGEFFKEISENENRAKLLAQSVASLRDFAAGLRGMAELVEGIEARIIVAGCKHEAFIQWMDEGLPADEPSH